MTENGRAWVGDEVHDEDADRTGIVTDVLNGTTYVLRPVRGTEQWTHKGAEGLTVLVPRGEL